MKKLLVSAFAFALVCQGETPKPLMGAIASLAPVITRPNSPNDQRDSAAVMAHFNCKTLHGPDDRSSSATPPFHGDGENEHSKL